MGLRMSSLYSFCFFFSFLYDCLRWYKVKKKKQKRNTERWRWFLWVHDLSQLTYAQFNIFVNAHRLIPRAPRAVTRVALLPELSDALLLREVRPGMIAGQIHVLALCIRAMQQSKLAATVARVPRASWAVETSIQEPTALAPRQELQEDQGFLLFTTIAFCFSFLFFF